MGGGRPVAPASEMLTWDIVNIAAVHKPVAVLGVAERRQVGGIGRTGSDVAPKAACRRERTTVTATGGRDVPQHPAVGDRGRWHRNGGMVAAPRPRESTSAMLGWGRTAGRDARRGVRGGERRLVGVRGQRRRQSKSQAAYKPPRAPCGRLNVPGELRHQARRRGSHHHVPTTPMFPPPRHPHHIIPTTTTSSPPPPCPTTTTAFPPPPRHPRAPRAMSVGYWG